MRANFQGRVEVLLGLLGLSTPSSLSNTEDTVIDAIDFARGVELSLSESINETAGIAGRRNGEAAIQKSESKL